MSRRRLAFIVMILLLPAALNLWERLDFSGVQSLAAREQLFLSTCVSVLGLDLNACQEFLNLHGGFISR